jgi:uncharacterized protein (DUF305 family)
MKLLPTLLLSLIGLLVGLVQAQGGHGPHHGPDRQAAMGMMMHSITSELDFLTQMIPHHQEAVAAARQLSTVTERPELRQLAEAIIDEQSREIALMQRWLTAWYPEAKPDTGYVPMMRDLSGLSPEDAERTFIEDMIAHHQMAVMMARQLLMRNLAEHDEVTELALEIISAQSAEIALLQSWLREGFGRALPPMPGMMAREMTDVDAMMAQCRGMMMPGGARMGQGMMAGRPHYDLEIVTALARAFLAGYGVEADITGVEAPRNLYRVTFGNGDASGVLLVDADTGEVRLEQE